MAMPKELFQIMSAQEYEIEVEQAKKEVAADLGKPIEQLACDVHLYAIAGSPGRAMAMYPAQASLHAQRHMTSMMARVAISNQRAAEASDRLQRRIYLLSAVVLFFTAIQAVGVIVSWVK